MFQTLKNAWKTQELKTKLLFTLLIVILYRLGSSIPVPFVDSASMAGVINSNFNYALQLIAGDAFGQATLFALSVSPYITSSIIIQLLTVASPALERLAKNGEEGKKKIDAITRIVTMGLALITAFGYTTLLVSNQAVRYMQNYHFDSTKGWLNAAGEAVNMKFFGVTGSDFFKFVVIIACYVAGAALVMWLAEKINDHGIGNGISVILFANIVARLPATFVNLFNMIRTADGVASLIISIVWAILIVAFLLALVWLIVWFTDSERRIPVQYAKKVVGRKMYGGQSSNLPLKLNMAGVMPVIFANSIVSIPGTLASIFPGTTANPSWISNIANYYFNYTKPLYVLLSIILLFAFAYFYILISFNPVEVANNIKNNGGAVPGIRPGRPTSDYIKKILNRITFIGAVFLCVVSELPKFIVALFETINEFSIVSGGTNALVDFYTRGASTFMTVAFSGTSVLIVVGVILETVRELEAQLTMRNYKGFLD